METQSTISTEQIISAVNQLSLPELEQVFERVLSLQAEKKACHLSAEESNLLSIINIGLPHETHQRISVLRTRRDDNSITDAEYEELTQLTDEFEEMHARRMTAMAALAKLRGVSLPTLMEQLGVQLPEYA